MKDNIKTFYSSKTWLNDKDSFSTDNVVCYDGEIKYEDSEKPFRQTHLKIADCHNIISLHTGSYDNIEDFIKKMELLRSEIDSFIDYLKSDKCPKNHE